MTFRGKNNTITYMRTLEVQSLFHSILFGCINAVMCIPVMISFTSIIFRDDAYRQVLPSLIKIVLFSCMIHQISFSVFSGLTFAVGQVQDAGLIFLSAMATSIVSGCHSAESILPTTLVVLSIYTALLGAMLILLGKMKLASVVQYLPLPVIGGYLAYIGFFCGQAGLAMMAGVEISTPSDWSKLLNLEKATLIIPGIILGTMQYVLLRSVKSAFTLPICMAVVLVVFYASLSGLGMNLQQARDSGWIAAMAPEIPFYEAWHLFSLRMVDWSQLLPQFPKFVAMVLVVAFSSSLDVAAIEMELGLPLDYNRELQTVGISNLFSGLIGGYTGSYIFSQTLFSLRRGVKSRVAGFVLAACELFLIVLPISVTSYLPKMFFGSMLVLISVDLMWEWLVVASGKMMAMEYATCLATFIFIMVAGIETGMAIGVLLSMISFVIVYAKLAALSSSSLLLRSSTVVRSYEERCALLSRSNRGKIVTITLKGYVFFGSAVKILEEVKSRVILTPAISIAEDYNANSSSNSNSAGDCGSEASQSIPMFTFLMGGAGRKVDGVQTEELSEAQRGGHGRPHNDGKMVEKSYSISSCESMEPITTGRSTSHSSRPESSSLRGGGGGGGSAYAPLSSSFYKNGGVSGSHAYGAVETGGERDWEAGRNKLDMYSTSEKKGDGRGLPPKSHPIPVIQSNHMPTTAVTGSSTGSEGHNIVGSPLQSLSVYDMPQDMMSSYQRRWMHDRGSIHLSQYPQTRSESPPSNSESFLDSTPSPPPDSIGVIQTQSEKSGRKHSRCNLPYPLPISCESLSSKSDVTQRSNSSSNYIALKTDEAEIPFKAIVEEASGCTIGLRTKSMSQLLLSSSNFTNRSILSAVWSSQERRREKVKHLSTPTLSTPGGVKDRMKDTGRRSRSYDSLGAVVHPADRLIGASDGSIYICMEELTDQPMHPVNEGIECPPLRPYSLSPHTPPVFVETQGQGAAEPTEFLILDFSEVLGIDATSARSCFLMLVQLMRSSGVTVVFAALSPGLESLLSVHGVIRRASGHSGAEEETDIVIATADGALEWCENKILARGRRGSISVAEKGDTVREERKRSDSLPSSLRALRRILQEHLEIEIEEEDEREEIRERTALSPHSLLDTEALSMFFKRQEVSEGSVVFDIGQKADSVYFIERGSVEIVLAAAHGSRSERVNKISDGGIFGEAAFFLDLPSSVRCVVLSERCVLWTLNRECYLKMEISHPQLCLLLQHALLKSLSISSTASLHALHPSAAYSILFE